MMVKLSQNHPQHAVVVLLWPTKAQVKKDQTDMFNILFAQKDRQVHDDIFVVL